MRTVDKLDPLPEFELRVGMGVRPELSAEGLDEVLGTERVKLIGDGPERLIDSTFGPDELDCVGDDRPDGDITDVLGRGELPELIELPPD